MKGIWDPDKGKYVKKDKSKRPVKWVHKNNYQREHGMLFKVGNKPYIKPKDGDQEENESKD